MPDVSIVDIEVIYHNQTERGVLVASDEDAEPVWLPKSQIEIEDVPLRGQVMEVTLPQWLAEEKGLV